MMSCHRQQVIRTTLRYTAESVTASAPYVGLSCCHLSDWDTVGTAGHVVHPDAVEEVDGHRVSAMLAMHSDL